MDVITTARTMMPTSAALSLTGPRQSNHDFALEDRRGIWAVADGIDSRPCGDYYARLGCNSIRNTLLAGDDPVGCLATANRKVHEALISGGETQGGAGIAFAHLANPNRMVLGIAGDVRAKLLRGSRLIDLFDGHYDCRHALGAHRFMDSYLVFEPKIGDRYLICSDGCANAVNDEQMAKSLRSARKPGEALAGMLLGRTLRDSSTALALFF